MILRAVAAFLLVLVVIPLGMGKALITGESGRLSFVGGYFASLFIFEILQLVFHVTMGSLRLMTLLWCLICVANYALFGFWLVAGGICIVILAVKKQIVFKLDAQDNTPYANTTAQKLGAFFSSPVLILSALYFVVSVITSIKKV